MRRILIAMVVYLLPGLALAQVTPRLQSGGKALLFSFSGLDNLNANSFNGGFGGKYFLSPTMALRLGVQLATASQDIPANPPAGLDGQDGKISGGAWGLNGALELHGGTGRVSPFVGLGIAYSTTSTENKDANIGPASGQTVIKNNPSGETIGGITFVPGNRFDVFALLGAEFFIVKELSLAAEYRLGFSNIAGKDVEVTQGTSSNKFKVGGTSGFGVDTAGVLTLAFYF